MSVSPKMELMMLWKSYSARGLVKEAYNLIEINIVNALIIKTPPFSTIKKIRT